MVVPSPGVKVPDLSICWGAVAKVTAEGGCIPDMRLGSAARGTAEAVAAKGGVVGVTTERNGVLRDGSGVGFIKGLKAIGAGTDGGGGGGEEGVAGEVGNGTAAASDWKLLTVGLLGGAAASDWKLSTG